MECNLIFHKHIVIALMMGAICWLALSCQNQTYMDMLTNGDIKYWNFGKGSTMYMSFNKNTKRLLYLDNKFERYYLSDKDSISQGQLFKTEGDIIVTSWVVGNDTLPLDSIEIVSISKRKLVLFYNHFKGPYKLYWSNKHKKQ